MLKRIIQTLCGLILTIMILLIIPIPISMIVSTPVEKHGIENFDEYTSTVGLTYHLFPDSDFLTKYTYYDAVYHYYDNCKLSKALEHVLAVLSYESDCYESAKQYCIKQMSLSQTNRKEYNGYVFIENLSLPEKYDDLENGINQDFPHHFTMFGYNDTTKQLIFIGFYCTFELYDEADLANTDFPAFLEKYYSGAFDFSVNQ